jgi:hypothetical protein
MLADFRAQAGPDAKGPPVSGRASLPSLRRLMMLRPHDDAGSPPPLGKCIVAEAVVHILDRQVGVTEKPDDRRLSGTTLRRSVIEQWRRS